IIAPGQGFVVQNVSGASNPSVTFTEASRLLIGDESVFYGKQTSLPDHARIEVFGDGVYNSAWVQFSDQGTITERTGGDVIQFYPFESEFAVISTVKQGELMDIGHFPYVNEDVEIPLTIETTTTAPLTLRLTDLQYGQVGTLYLYDTVTGESIELHEGMEYEFTPSGSPAKALNSCYTSPQKVTSGGEVRFIITGNIPADEPTGPSEIALKQNFPNPFNPTTQITYQLPVRSDVTLSVHDITGRQVATLINESVAAGTHTVTFDAANLASGVYMYRLQAGSTVLSRKLTVIK
ncbi:MAG: T9SS C-terminal target domain-containing protein, partial [Balneolaceae bacterium]